MNGEAERYGILACAAYLPRWRIERSTISKAIGWSRGMSAPGKGTRSFAHWDEDCITMAVEAARGLVAQRESFDSVELASTTAPFADRNNAGIVREALNLDPACRPFDLGGSRRSASSRLAQCLEARKGRHLLIASDCVDARPGSESEMLLGHGAAAVALGPAGAENGLLARCLASQSLHEDFVDQYRMGNQRFDYRLESRWIRDAGTRGQLKALIGAALEAAGVDAEAIDYLVISATESVSRTVARDCGMEGAQRPAELEARIGLCGTAHALLGLAWALEQAQPGQHMLVAGLGQGADVLILKVERAAPLSGKPLGVQMQQGRMEENYSRYAGLRGLMPIDGGIRAERDNRTAQSAHYRRHQDLTGFVGGRCNDCGQLQYPRTAVCVECHAPDTQAPEPMADLVGHINSYTEDWLAFSPRPPLIFGSVHFPGGANLTMEFGDFLPGEAEVGQPIRMAFRIKDVDSRRHFQRYFWKPVPLDAEPGDG